MVECLLALLGGMKHPEIFFFLEMTDRGPQWKRFRQPPKTYRRVVTDGSERNRVEEAILDIYLAHLSQWCQPQAQSDDNMERAGQPLIVPCPQTLLEYVSRPSSPRLETALRTVRRVSLRPGRWQDRPGVLKWQASFAAWRKRGCRGSATLHRAVPGDGILSELPPPYNDTAHHAHSRSLPSTAEPPKYHESCSDAMKKDGLYM